MRKVDKQNTKSFRVTHKLPSVSCRFVTTLLMGSPSCSPKIIARVWSKTAGGVVEWYGGGLCGLGSLLTDLIGLEFGMLLVFFWQKILLQCVCCNVRGSDWSLKISQVTFVWKNAGFISGTNEMEMGNYLIFLYNLLRVKVIIIIKRNRMKTSRSNDLHSIVQSS